MSRVTQSTRSVRRNTLCCQVREFRILRDLVESEITFYLYGFIGEMNHQVMLAVHSELIRRCSCITITVPKVESSPTVFDNESIAANIELPFLVEQRISDVRLYDDTVDTFLTPQETESRLKCFFRTVTHSDPNSSVSVLTWFDNNRFSFPVDTFPGCEYPLYVMFSCAKSYHPCLGDDCEGIDFPQLGKLHYCLCQLCLVCYRCDSLQMV